MHAYETVEESKQVEVYEEDVDEYSDEDEDEDEDEDRYKKDIEDWEGLSFLLNAVRKGDLAAVQNLLELDDAGIYETWMGCSVFFFAIACGHRNIAQWLLKEGKANISDKVDEDYGGYTALLFAVMCKRWGIAQWLLADCGANIFDKNEQDETALLLAVKSGQLNFIQWLFRTGRVYIDDKDVEGNIELLRVALVGSRSFDTVTWLISEAGMRIDKRDRVIVLVYAVLYKKFKTARWLLQTGFVSIHDRDSAFRTPFLLAAFNGYLDVMQWFLTKCKANIGDRDNEGNTALLLMVVLDANYYRYYGNCGAKRGVRWLLQESGAKIDESNNHGHTIVDLIITRRDTGLFHMLIDEFDIEGTVVELALERKFIDEEDVKKLRHHYVLKEEHKKQYSPVALELKNVLVGSIEIPAVLAIIFAYCKPEYTIKDTEKIIEERGKQRWEQWAREREQEQEQEQLEREQLEREHEQELRRSCAEPYRVLDILGIEDTALDARQLTALEQYSIFNNDSSRQPLLPREQHARPTERRGNGRCCCVMF